MPYDNEGKIELGVKLRASAIEVRGLKCFAFSRTFDVSFTQLMSY